MLQPFIYNFKLKGDYAHSLGWVLILTELKFAKFDDNYNFMAYVITLKNPFN